MERYVNNYYPTVDQMAIDGGVVGVNDVHMDRWTPFVLRSDYDALHKQLTDAQATIAALRAEVKDLKEWLAAYKQSIELAQSSLTQRTAELEAAKAEAGVICPTGAADNYTPMLITDNGPTSATEAW